MLELFIGSHSGSQGCRDSELQRFKRSQEMFSSGVCRFRVEGFKGSGEEFTGLGFPWFRSKGLRDSEDRGSGAQGFRASRIQRFSRVTGAAGQKFREFGARWASGGLGSSKAHLARNSGWVAQGGVLQGLDCCGPSWPEFLDGLRFRGVAEAGPSWWVVGGGLAGDRAGGTKNKQRSPSGEVKISRSYFFAPP